MTTIEDIESNLGCFEAIEPATGGRAELAMEQLLLTGELLPVGARLLVRHSFATSNPKPLEVVYSFMLPRDAALRRFRVSGPGFSARSELKPVAEAEQAYEEGLEEGHLATLARIHRDGVVNLALGNLRAGEPVTIWLEILAGVEQCDTGYRFRFPFTMAPSYHRNARVIALPDGGEIELPEDRFDDVLLPPFRTDAEGLHEIGFALEVKGPGDDIEVGSPSHPIRTRHNSGGARVSLATAADVPDRDLVLDVSVETPRVFVAGGSGEDGRNHFAVTIPSTEFDGASEEPRTVVFLLDRSGSMAGKPIGQARRALLACLATLEGRDRFGIVAFDNVTESFRDKLAAASVEERAAARNWLGAIDARGGTELASGVTAAARLLGAGGGEIFIVTDGQVWGTEDVLASVRGMGARLHTLGIGSASQDRFLTLLARQTGGVSRFVTPRERVDTAALDLFAAVSRPIATELKVAAGDLGDCDPRPNPEETVHAGSPAVIWGDCDAGAAGSIELVWKHDGRVEKRKIPLNPAGMTSGETLRLLRGARLITDCEAAMDSGSEGNAIARRREKRLNAQLEALSRRYGLASRAMSLVAVIERAGDRPGELPRTQVVPVGMPLDMSVEGVFSAPAAIDMLAAPALRVSNQRACRISSALEEIVDPEDELMDLATLLDPDGGMPGDSTEERILNTLLAMLALAATGSTPGSGAFRSHLKRMLAFLERHLPAGLDEEEEASARAAIQAVHDGSVHDGQWHSRAGGASRNMSGQSTSAWEALRRAHGGGGF